MKKLLLFMLMGFVMMLNGCGIFENPDGPIKVGYINSFGDMIDFPGLVCFTIANPIGSADEPVEILFEYGHDYDLSQYEDIELTHTLSVFVSKPYMLDDHDNEANVFLYETILSDFMTEAYRCDVNRQNVFANIVYHQSFSMSISPSDIPYETGVFYFLIYRNMFESDDPYQLHQFASIYFTNVDGVLTFTRENPGN